MGIIENSLCGIVLALCSFQDIKGRYINIVPPVMLSAFVILYGIIKNGNIDVEVLISIIPGLTLLIISFISKEMVGFGDGVIVGCMGICSGIYKEIIVLGISFLLIWLSCIVGIICGRRIHRKTALPYVPYVLMAWIIVTVMDIIAL